MLDVRGDLEALVAEAHRRVEQRALEREAAAERRSTETLNEARDAAAAIVHDHRQRTEAEAADLRERVLALGEMRSKRVALEQREALLDTVWNAARARLAALPDDRRRYLATLRRLAALAARGLGVGEVELASEVRGHDLLTPERLEAWGTEDGVRYRRAAAPVPMMGGLVASSDRLRVDVSFDTRLQVAREELRERTAALLLEGDADPETEG
jgi:vacuolar-type H+-ATPase subunit E/Vma4